MAAKKQPNPQLYDDTPLADDGQTEMGALWLAALDEIIPGTPLDLIDLLRIIGPDGDEAGQNKRAAALVVNPVTGVVGVNVRTIQRYRRASLGLGGEIRGASTKRRIQIINNLAPVARVLILRRFFQLCENFGLAGYFAGLVRISKKVRHFDRHGGVPAEYMPPTVDNLMSGATGDHEGGYEAAAWTYWHDWLADWGTLPNASGKDAASAWGDLLDYEDSETGMEVDTPEVWILALGYPPTDAAPRNPAEWWADAELAPYRDPKARGA